MMNLSISQWQIVNDKKVRGAAALLALVLGGLLWLCVWQVIPAVSELRELEQRHAAIRKRQAEALLFKKRQLSLAGVMRGVPSQQDMPLIVKDLVQIVHALDLSVSSVKYDIPKRATGELELLTFSFPARGTYPALKHFIYDVETSDRLIGIQSLRMEADKDKGAVNLDMKLLTYIKGQ